MDGLPKIEAIDFPDDEPPGSVGTHARVEQARPRPQERPYERSSKGTTPEKELRPRLPFDPDRPRKTTAAQQLREQRRAASAQREQSAPVAPAPEGIPMPVLTPRAEPVLEAAATAPRGEATRRQTPGEAEQSTRKPRDQVPKRRPSGDDDRAVGKPRDRVPKRSRRQESGGDQAQPTAPQQRPQPQRPEQPQPQKPDQQPQQRRQVSAQRRPAVRLPENPPRLPPGPPPVRRRLRPDVPRLPSAPAPSPDGGIGRIEPKQVPADQAGPQNARPMAPPGVPQLLPQAGTAGGPPSGPPQGPTSGGNGALAVDPEAGREFLPPPPDNYTALSSLRETTDLANCLIPLLEALAWRGDPRHIAESVPHFINNLDVTSFRNVLANLHYESRPVEIEMSEIDARLMPCLFLPEGKDALILLGAERMHFRACNGGLNDYVEIPKEPVKGLAYFFTRLETDELIPAQQKVGWFRAVTERFRSLVYQTLGLTFLLNILALATPLFVMAVYDKVVATGSMKTLAYFAVGVGIAIVCDMILRGIRSRIMAFIGARLDTIVGNAVFHRILFLPPQFTERATVGAQVARIKDFETIRDFFTGPMALTFFELPFTLIFVIVIAVIAGPLAVVPMVMFVLFLLVGAVIQPLLRQSVAKAARGSSRRQELVVETLGNMRAVKYSGAEATWLQRFRDNSAKASLNSFYTAQYSSLIQTISTVLMTASGLATIVFGVFRVLSGDMTIGALVASMILVWRILSPLQSAFISMTRVTQVRSSIQQINALMNLRAEREPHALVNPIRRLKGYISFARVSLRYSPDADPALVGVQFDIEPGEIVCVVGGNGSGKSTILKLLAGMYAPQAGSIRMDNQDIRQMDTVELRHAVSYVPQTFQFFYGTIAQNLRLAHPTATEADLRWAAEKASVLEDIEALEQGSGKWKRKGFEVRIGDQGSGSMPTSLLQKLNLARGFLKRAPIMLFDEPGNGLDFEGDQAFMKQVNAMRGYVTVLIVTHRPSHLKLADKIIWLEEGHLRAAGPAAEVRKQLPKDFL